MNHLKNTFCSHLAICFITLLSISSLRAQVFVDETQMFPNTTENTITTTWTVPAGVSSVVIECWGGGGSGARISSGANCGGCGGGGGAYARSIVNVSMGDVFTIEVGAGGRSTERWWSKGHESRVSINGVSTVMAVGGSSAGPNVTSAIVKGGQASSCLGDVTVSGGDGGVGCSGNDSGSGGGGAAGGINGRGGDGNRGYIDQGGSGGNSTSTLSGNGADGVTSFCTLVTDICVGNDGNNGQNYGGGGSGATGNGLDSHNGGAGGGGLVRLTYVNVCRSVTPGAISAETWNCSAADTTVLIKNTEDALPAGGTYSWIKDSTVIEDSNRMDLSTSTSGKFKRGYAYQNCPVKYTDSVVVKHPATINPGLILYTENPLNICEGKVASVIVKASPDDDCGTVYWQKKSAGSDWTDIATGITFSEHIPNISEDIQYRYLIAPGTNCLFASKNIFNVHTLATPIVSLDYVPHTCPVESFQVTADVQNTTSPIYEWSCPRGISSSVDNVLTVTGLTCNTKYSYSLKVTDAITGCHAMQVSSYTTSAGAAPESSYFTALSNTETVNAILETGCKNTMPDVLTYVASKFEYPATMSGCTGVFTAAYPAGATVPAVGAEITNDVIIDGITVSDACGNVSTQTIKIVVKTHKAPVVMIASDKYMICNGDYATFTASVTPAAGNYTYAWDNGLGNTASVEIPYNTAVASYTAPTSAVYSVTATDEYGCVGTNSRTLRFAPLVPEYDNASDNICATTGYTKNFTPSSAYSNDYARTYTWTVKSNPDNIAGAVDNTTPAAAFSAASLSNSGLASATVVYTVTPYQTGTDFDCTGNAFEFALTVKPSIKNTGALTYDDADVVTTLYYGACDTLLNILVPQVATAIAEWQSSLVITNNVSTTNTGALLGRLVPGTNVITWTVTDPCGNQVSFEKKYIVNFPPCGSGLTATDADGNVYETVRIGCECWTKSNLTATKYSDGTAIASANGYTSNDHPNADENIANFGRLYTWYSAMNVTEGNDNAVPATLTDPVSHITYVQGACPEGWAIPTVATMQNAASSVADMSGMKTTDESKWLPGAAGNDASGFKAVAAGYYDSFTDKYLNLLGETFFWSCDNATASEAQCMNVSYYCPQALYQNKMKGMGFSVRCVKRAN